MELCRRFYFEAVRPTLEAQFPGLPHSAAHLGRGSDVLGFDTPQSMDHHWGPKVDIFLEPGDHSRHASDIDAILRGSLPRSVAGFPTHFADPEIDGGRMASKQTGPLNHGVRFFTIQSFFGPYLGWDPANPLEPAGWLTFPEQKLRTVRSGRVFHDGLGALSSIRAKLHYYPRDVWLYRLAAGWRRISQEEAFLGRTGDVGDDLGSRLLAARLVQDLISLCFMLERQYAPYIKWLGTAFRQLACAGELMPVFHKVLRAEDWRRREAHLSEAYHRVAEIHNGSGITPPLSTKMLPFHRRPYLVPHAQRFVEALRGAIEDPAVRALPPYLGSVDQYIDSTDILDDGSAAFLPRLQALYRLGSA